MCLKQVFTKKERENILAKLPNEFAVWKIAINFGANYKKKGWKRRFRSAYRLMLLHAGEVEFETNTIVGNGIKYKGGGHFWLHKKDATNSFSSSKIIQCRIKKEWVVHIGIEEIDNFGSGLTIVTKKAIFPKYVKD